MCRTCLSLLRSLEPTTAIWHNYYQTLLITITYFTWISDWNNSLLINNSGRTCLLIYLADTYIYLGNFLSLFNLLDQLAFNTILLRYDFSSHLYLCFHIWVPYLTQNYPFIRKLETAYSIFMFLGSLSKELNQSVELPVFHTFPII